MKTKSDYLFWGILLILAAGLAFVQQQGWVEALSLHFWALAFGGAGLVFFARYLVAGCRNWGWLFPACMFTALAGIAWAGIAGNREVWLSAPIFAAIVIPFLVAFAIDFRRNWWALIPAFVLSVICTLVIFIGNVRDELMGAFILFDIALPFLVVYLSNREKKMGSHPGVHSGSVGRNEFACHDHKPSDRSFRTFGDCGSVLFCLLQISPALVGIHPGRCDSFDRAQCLAHRASSWSVCGKFFFGQRSFSWDWQPHLLGCDVSGRSIQHHGHVSPP